MFKKILVPLDTSELAAQALGTAAAIADESHAGIELLLVHPDPPLIGFSVFPLDPEEEKDDDWYLESVAREFASASSHAIAHAVVRGNPVESICARCHE